LLQVNDQKEVISLVNKDRVQCLMCALVTVMILFKDKVILCNGVIMHQISR